MFQFRLMWINDLPRDFLEIRISFYDVFKFLSSLTPDYRIRDLVLMHENVKKLCDVRKLCEYAEKEGWVARVHEYPALNAIQDEHGLKLRLF